MITHSDDTHDHLLQYQMVGLRKIIQSRQPHSINQERYIASPPAHNRNLSLQGAVSTLFFPVPALFDISHETWGSWPGKTENEMEYIGISVGSERQM